MHLSCVNHISIYSSIIIRVCIVILALTSAVTTLVETQSQDAIIVSDLEEVIDQDTDSDVVECK